MTEAWAVVRNGAVTELHDADLIVPWWSFTKTAIAAACLALVRDGVLALDEPLPNRPYSLRQLLEHRAGLPEYGELSAYHEAVARGDDPWPVASLFERVGADRLRYEPGTGWGYSNVGYAIARQLLESMTGQGLDDALQRLVLKPLGVNAWVAQERRDLEGVIMGEATAYHPGWVYHGLLVGSVKEAALLLDGIIAGDLLPKELREEMLAPLVIGGPIPGRIWTVPGYGLGIMTGATSRDLSIAGHTGGGPGSSIAVYQAGAETSAYFTTNDPARSEGRAAELLST
ncbi:serine hydrolase domain-containing protein [Microvirga terricola]|uniref:Beta-lactamase family protein n=1 Tax=Microvirga terricola TaxID=2719797 RepID=A0ABX0VDL7_9HYPH|nr:serine hydrolase domain-containing protein [Microvirga terricola]NIX77561.1 beta-lactamase family protein [Microvirga terricola]